LSNLGSLTGVYSCFSSCPKKVAVTFGCSYLIYCPISSGVIPEAFLIRKLFVCACVQVILQWVLGKGVSCIVRSYNRGRQLENFESQGWKLVDADIQTVDGLPNQKRYLDPDYFIDPVHGPFKTKKDFWGEE
jgi:diketogulonate reductase-like aldo/keto reductase